MSGVLDQLVDPGEMDCRVAEGGCRRDQLAILARLEGASTQRPDDDARVRL